MAVSKNSFLAARGVGILAVMLGHTGSFYPLPNVYYWHIPIFFFLMGSNIAVHNDVGRTAVHVLKSAVLYLIVWNFIYLALLYPYSGAYFSQFVPPDIFRVSQFTFEIVKYNNHEVGFLAPCWFLIAYSTSSIFSTVAYRLCRRQALPTLLVAIVCGYGGWSFGSPDGIPYGHWQPVLITHMLLGSSFCLAGAVFFSQPKAFELAISPTTILCSLGLFLFVVTRWKPAATNMAWGVYDARPAIFFITTMLGVHLAFCLAHAFRESRLLQLIGKNSKAIMTHHLFGYFLLNVVLFSMGKVQWNELRPYTTVAPEMIWPAYLVFGLAFAFSVEWVSVALMRYVQNKAANFTGRYFVPSRPAPANSLSPLSPASDPARFRDRSSNRPAE